MWRGSIHGTSITGHSVVACQSLRRTTKPKNQIPQVHRHLTFGNGKVVPVDAMRAHGGSGCMAPHVNLGTGEICVVSFAPHPPYLPPTGSQCIVGSTSSRASPDASEQRKICYHCRESNHVACSTVTIPTELFGSPSDGGEPKILRSSDAVPGATPDNSFV